MTAPKWMAEQCRTAAARLREILGDPKVWTDLDEIADYLDGSVQGKYTDELVEDIKRAIRQNDSVTALRWLDELPSLLDGEPVGSWKKIRAELMEDFPRQSDLDYETWVARIERWAAYFLHPPQERERDEKSLMAHYNYVADRLGHLQSAIRGVLVTYDNGGNPHAMMAKLRAILGKEADDE